MSAPRRTSSFTTRVSPDSTHKNGPVKVKAAVQIDLDILARQCEQLECQVLVATANGADEGRHLGVEFEHFLCRIPGICHNPSCARMASTANPRTSQK